MRQHTGGRTHGEACEQAGTNTRRLNVRSRDAVSKQTEPIDDLGLKIFGQREQLHKLSHTGLRVAPENAN